MIGLRLGLSSSKGLLKGVGSNLPQAPSNFLASADNRAINLTWDAVDGAIYSIYRNTEDSSETASLLEEEESSQSFTDSTVLSGNIYFYWVKSVNASGESSFSEPSSARAYVSILNGGTVNLQTPTGSWTLSTVLFGISPLVDNIYITFDGNVYFSFDGDWLNAVTEENSNNIPVDGSFSVNNNSGSTITFWNENP